MLDEFLLPDINFIDKKAKRKLQCFVSLRQKLQCLLLTNGRKRPSWAPRFGPGCQWPAPASPHPPIPPSTTPPADPPAGHGSPHPCFCLHRVESTQRTLRARLSCIGGRPRAGGPPQLAGAQYRTGPAPSLDRRRTSVRDTTAQHTGC